MRIRAALLAATALWPVATFAATNTTGQTLPGAITPSHGTITVNGDVYSIDASNGDVALINGAPINDGAYETGQLMQGADGAVYGQSNAENNNGEWFRVSGSSGNMSWQPISGTPSPVPRLVFGPVTPTTQIPSPSDLLTNLRTQPPAAPPLAMPAIQCGQPGPGYSVTNDQIIGPTGQPFVAKGVDIWSQQAINDPTGAANQIETMFPGTTMIRVAMGDPGTYNTDTAAAIAPFVNLMTSKGVVVELGDYNPAYTSSVPTGAGLQAETAWFSSLATAFNGNQNVWFSTANEPSDTYSGATAAEQQAVYNAIRATGSNAMVGLENTQWAGGSSASITPSNTTGMKNVFLDVHYYNWLAGYSTDVGSNQASLLSEVAAAQAAYGNNIPVIIGEFGNSTTGEGADPGGTATVSAVTSSGLGYTAWGINPGGSGDQLTNGNSLTGFGQQVAQAVTSPADPGATTLQSTAAGVCNVSQVPPAPSTQYAPQTSMSVVTSSAFKATSPLTQGMSP